MIPGFNRPPSDSEQEVCGYNKGPSNQIERPNCYNFFRLHASLNLPVPIGSQVRVHPAPVVAVVSSTPPAIHTSCCECDGPWCCYFFFGILFHVCTGYFLNEKIKGSMCLWQCDLLVSIICTIMFVLSITLGRFSN